MLQSLLPLITMLLNQDLIQWNQELMSDGIKQNPTIQRSGEYNFQLTQPYSYARYHIQL